MTFISIHSVIIYVVSFGACMRCTRLCSLKLGVTLAVFWMLFYLTHPRSSRFIKHNDIQIGQPGLQVRTSSRKQEDLTAWGPVLKNGNPFHGVVRSLCGRLA
jgi:hypothetical protein